MNKSKIAMWITYWPLSLLWSLIDDFIHKLIKEFVRRLQFLYDGIAKKVYAKI